MQHDQAPTSGKNCGYGLPIAEVDFQICTLSHQGEYIGSFFGKMRVASPVLCGVMTDAATASGLEASLTEYGTALQALA